MESILHLDFYDFLRRRGPNSRSTRGLWCGFALLLLSLNLYAPADPTVIERLLANAIVFVSFVSILYWQRCQDGRPDFGFLPLLMILFVLYFALPIFTLKLYVTNIWMPFPLPDFAVERALALCLVGLMAILFGYYAPIFCSAADLAPKVNLRWRSKRITEVVAILFAIVGMAAFLATMATDIPREAFAYVVRSADLVFFSIAALFILQLEGEISWTSALFLWVILIPSRVLIGTMQGSFAYGIRVAIVLVITYATIRRRIPWLMIIAGFGAFIILQPLKDKLRSSVFTGGWESTEISESDKFTGLVGTFQLVPDIVESTPIENLISISTLRLADIMFFALVVSETPENIPYWGGETYYPILVAPIPRIIYRDKPQENVGNTFGHRYNILSPDNWQTSINIPQIIELYGNFGVLGLVLGSLLIGVVYRIFDSMFLHKGSPFGSVVAGIYLFTCLSDLENSGGSVFGGLFIESFVIVVFHLGIRFTEELVRATQIRQMRAVAGGMAK